MRLLFICLSLLAVSVTGCRCSPSQATPVTLRLKNSSTDPIFVDDTGGALGLQLQRNVAGMLYGFDDTPACECVSCELVCGCDCSGVVERPFIRKVMPGQTFERGWSGDVQVSGVVSCGSFDNRDCLKAEAAPADEELTLELCYQLQVTGLPELPDGGTFEAVLPKTGRSCVQKTFRPMDGVVEVGPRKGATCTTSAECVGPGEQCFSGSCTTGCPDNGYPVLGSGWALRIPSPDDQGFFTQQPGAVDGGIKVVAGTGTVTSVLYQGTTMVIRLSRLEAGTGDTLRGAVYLQLPPGPAAPLEQGSTVQVRVIDGSSRDNPDNRALVVRSMDGGLLLAADMAQQGSLLTPADTTPWTVSFPNLVLGCRQDQCGKQLFFPTKFQGPDQALTLDPGKSATQVSGQGTYRALNVFSASYGQTSCDLFDFRPWAIWRER